MVFIATFSWHFLSQHHIATSQNVIAIVLTCMICTGLFTTAIEGVDVTQAVTIVLSGLSGIAIGLSFLIDAELLFFSIFFITVMQLLLAQNDQDMEEFASKYFYKALCENGMVHHPKDDIEITSPFWRQLAFNVLPYAGVPIFIYLYERGHLLLAGFLGGGIGFIFFFIIVTDHLRRHRNGTSLLWSSTHELDEASVH